MPKIQNSMYEKINEIIKQNKKSALCIVTDTKGSTPRKIGSKMIVFDDKTSIGTIGGGKIELEIINKTVEIIKQGKPKLIRGNLDSDYKMACGGIVDVYIEPLIQLHDLFVFGAGHIGKTLAHFCKKLDFNITVIDERQGIFDDWNNKEFNLINKSFEQAFKIINFDNNSFICAVSHTHEFDKEILTHCGKQEFAYLGMLGSSKKTAKIKKEFLENNILTKDEIEKIDMPIGVPINCETPEEIAISIIAKLIDVKNSKEE